MVEVRIEHIGREGDGVGNPVPLATGGDVGPGPVFVPGAVPGDRVRAAVTGRRGGGLEARATTWLERGERAEPPCPHFGASGVAADGTDACGGCHLQHLTPSAYRAFRTATIDRALRSQGLEAPVREPVVQPAGTRRRVRLAFDRPGGALHLGYRTRQGHTVVGIRACPVARPEIVAALSDLQALAEALGADRIDRIDRGEIAVTVTETGLDVLLHLDTAPGLAARQAIAAVAARADLARVALAVARARPEPLVVRRPPTVRFETTPAQIPPGAFLQASIEAEVAIRAAVRDGLGDATRIADLFAGCGTFALPEAAAGRSVLAIDGDPLLIETLRAAAPKRAAKAGRIETRAQDLERSPLRGQALRSLDAVVLDPPRRGARAQCAALATSAVPRIVMVSCAPDTFARDVRILESGGYRLQWVQPIDAFLWSLETEVVALLTLT